MSDQYYFDYQQGAGGFKKHAHNELGAGGWNSAAGACFGSWGPEGWGTGGSDCYYLLLLLCPQSEVRGKYLLSLLFLLFDTAENEPFKGRSLDN